MQRIFTAVILLMAAFTFSVAQITSIPAAAGGGGGAPTDAQYLVLTANGSLSAERVFTLDTNMTGTDGGAGGNYTIGPDTAKMESRLNAQAGGSNYSVTAGSSTVYTAALTPSAQASAPSLYSNGGVIRVKWDETCGANPTLNVDSLGARKIYKRNGTSASTQLGAGECIANQINVLTYNSSLDSGTGGWETDIGGGGVPATGANGIVVCTGTNCSTSTTRTITASGGIAITNGDGVSAAPAIASTVYNDGYYAPFGIVPSGTGLSAPIANRVYIYTHRATESFTFTKIAGANYGVASKGMACGVYDSSKNIIVQGRLDSGNGWFSGGTSGTQISVSATTLTQGTLYYISCAFEDTGMSAIHQGHAWFEKLDPAPHKFGYAAETATGSNTTYALPSSFTTITHEASPNDAPIYIILLP